MPSALVVDRRRGRRPGLDSTISSICPCAVPVGVADQLGDHHVRGLEPVARRATEPCAVTMSLAIPAAVRRPRQLQGGGALHGASSETSRCEHTRMAGEWQGLSAPPRTCSTLRETFQIARGAADEETVVRRRARAGRDRRLRRGRAGRLLGRDARRDRRGDRGRRARAAGRRPVRGRGDLRPAGGLGRSAGREDGARRARPRLARQARSGSRSGGCWAPTASTPPTSYTIGIDSVEGTAGQGAPRDRLRGLKIKVGGPGDLERLRAVRAETRRSAADRRQRGLGPRRPRGDADARADRARRRVRRAAVPGGGHRQLRRATASCRSGCRC